MAIGMTLGIWGIVWISLAIKDSTIWGSLPLYTWKVIHSTDSFVLELPTIVLGPVLVYDYRYQSWGVPGAAYIFFLLFATSPEVWSEYQGSWMWFRTKVLRRPLPEKSLTVSSLRTGYVHLIF